MTGTCHAMGGQLSLNSRHDQLRRMGRQWGRHGESRQGLVSWIGEWTERSVVNHGAQRAAGGWMFEHEWFMLKSGRRP